ncbi:MAG: sugar phosphate isomerase/epimerase [Verrucomicrobia bacterium]|jgi:sugar phosphate isomerase/epimerase|nr:sugar phosphate isomerase/epimerase [Verrucomicrobiota bacterium]
MKFSLCNEMFEDVPLSEVCSTARSLGYHGLELAPFTLCRNAYEFSVDARKEAGRIVRDHGLEVVGLHWLYVGTENMHMTSPCKTLWSAARDYLEALIGICADMDGTVLVIGSPNQRSLTDGQSYEDGWHRATALFESVLDAAAERNVTLCVEPLSPKETDFLNTVSDGVKMVHELDHPNFKVHLDVKAMSAEDGEVAEIIRATRLEDIGHFHVNDPNLYGPGMGDVDYGPIAEAVNKVGWDKWLSVEVFKYDPDPLTIARESMDCLKRYW